MPKLVIPKLGFVIMVLAASLLPTALAEPTSADMAMDAICREVNQWTATASVLIPQSFTISQLITPQCVHPETCCKSVCVNWVDYVDSDCRDWCIAGCAVILYPIGRWVPPACLAACRIVCRVQYCEQYEWVCPI